MKETRICAVPVEVRGTGDGTATIAGYAAVFGNEYEVAGFTESVDARAFTKTLKDRRDSLAVVWSHDADRVLGTAASGSARFSVDERGLWYEADLDLLDPDGMSAYRKIATGKVRESSFSFEVVKDHWEERDEAPPHRVIKEVRLWECSPCLWGANPATQVDVKRAARSLAEALGVDEAESIPEVIDLAHRSTTPEPEPEPVESHSEPTPEPEQTRRITYPYV